MTIYAKVFEELRDHYALWQNFDFFLTRFAVAIEYLFASVDKKSLFIRRSLKIDISTRFYFHESFYEHLKQNFDNLDARIRMFDTLF
jgi:hypothetical protein